MTEIPTETQTETETDGQLGLDEIPTDHGPKMKMWLERFGLVAQKPYIRASDFYLASACDEFLYYLKRRLCLTRPLEYSEAMSRGTWFHEFARTLVDPEHSPSDRLRTRLAELKATCNSLGIIGERQGNILKAEQADYDTAGAWWGAALAANPPNLEGIIKSFRCLGAELSMRAIYRLGTSPIILAGRMDLLLFDEKEKALWVPDYKTTSEPPSVRLSTVPFEFQSVHYLMLLTLLLEEDWFREKYSLPQGTKVGGVMHIAFQKPIITLCSKDRDFTWEDDSKGKPKKVYTGEPRRENYQKRVTEWVRGEGEYLDASDDVKREPRVNLSIVDAGLLLNKNRVARYTRELEWMGSLANRPAYPDNFRQASHHLREYGKISPWAGFYAHHPRDWPSIIKRDGLLIGEPDDRQEFEGPPLNTRIEARTRKVKRSASLLQTINSHRTSD